MGIIVAPQSVYTKGWGGLSRLERAMAEQKVFLPRSTLRSLLNWFSLAARELPWRSSRLQKNPYAIWISEVMSQQSTMATVVPYFERWMRELPTLDALVNAHEEDVLSLWAGLGYYSRARNIKKGAALLSEYIKQKERWPQTEQEWLLVPGVGPYTAAAICSICFDVPTVAIDGNVLRVAARYLGISDPLNKLSDRKKIESALNLVLKRVPIGQRGDFTQALMELGASICKPGTGALCKLCPVKKDCRAGDPGKAARLPLKKVRPASERVLMLLPLYKKNKGSQVLLRKIPSGCRLAGQWELPALRIEGVLGPARERAFIDQVNDIFEVFGPISHSITHHRYQCYGVKVGDWGAEKIPSGHRFFEIASLLGAKPASKLSSREGVVTTATRKLLHFLVDSSS